MKNIDMDSLFLGLQSKMLCDLDYNRSVIDHPGTLGDATELDWIGMLRDFLPARYSIDKAAY